MATSFKQVKNGSKSLVATAPSPATSGTSLTVTTGEGAKFPAAPFWATIWNKTSYYDARNDPSAETVLVTAVSTDTFTITRAQLGSSARSVIVGDNIEQLLVDQQFLDIHSAVNNVETGWVAFSPTLTYSSGATGSSTGNNYGVVTASGDLTGVLGTGMRVQYTQSATVQYAIITSVVFSAGTTTIVWYNGANYSTTNTTISAVSYSTHKAPLGFPTDPAQWTVRKAVSTSAIQTSPSNTSWYNLGSFSMSLPPGTWRVEYWATVGISIATAGDVGYTVSLSTSATSVSDAELNGFGYSTATGNFFSPVSRAKNIATTGTGLTAYYLIAQPFANYTNIRLDTEAYNVIQAVCNYL